MSASNRKLKLHELGRISVEEYKAAEKLPLILILDSIRSKANVGSTLRTADAFRIEKVYLCGITPQPPDRDITKTALGAEESVDWTFEKEVMPLLQRLKTEGYTLISIEQCADSAELQQFQAEPGQKYAIVMGNEVKGVAQDVVDLSDHVIEIPQFGTKHSLNVSVTAGIVLHWLQAGMRH